MSGHTKEPWSLYIDMVKGDPLGRSKVSIIAEGITICEMYYPVGGVYGDISKENAHRIVACMNACEGVSTEQLEQYQKKGALKVLADNLKLELQRDKLLAFASHRNESGFMCELLKHSNYPCNCGLDSLIAEIEASK